MKKMFYYTDLLPFLMRGDAAIDKLERCLGIFHDASEDIRLVWHPWSGTARYLELNNSPVKKKYDEIVKKYTDEAWGELDTSDSFAKTKDVLLSCDGYYGDNSDLIYEAQNAEIPVMIQNIDV